MLRGMTSTSLQTTSFSLRPCYVIDPNTVEDRFLFTFNVVVIIAKPIRQGRAVFNDTDHERRGIP
jgi:hypothetical protein